MRHVSQENSPCFQSFAAEPEQFSCSLPSKPREHQPGQAARGSVDAEHERKPNRMTVTGFGVFLLLFVNVKKQINKSHHRGSGPTQSTCCYCDISPQFKGKILFKAAHRKGHESGDVTGLKLSNVNPLHFAC